MRTRAGLLLLTAVLVLAGCGNGSPQSQPSLTSTPTGSGTATSTPSVEPSASAPPVPANSTDLVAYIMAGSAATTSTYRDPAFYVDDASFTAPSGNIKCGL